MKKIIFFIIFFRKIWKNVEKSENDEKGSEIDEKGQLLRPLTV